jgi:hypothetical protein
MNIREYCRIYGQDPTNNFAVACYEGNSIEELREALRNDADPVDCDQWGISPEEWTNAIEAALNERLADLEREEK